MTDREMLELAAKAAGYVVEPDAHIPSGGLWLSERDGDKQWSPLANDGDALRVAVKLHMQVSVTTESCRAETLSCLGVRVNDEDEMLATRRAIVMAAAEIGRGME